MSVAFDPHRRAAYVAVEGDGTVVCIDSETLTRLGEVQVGGQPYAVAVAPVTGAVYALDRKSGRMTILDGQRRHVLASLSVGREPLAVTFDPVRNTNSLRVYVASSGNSLVTCIDGQTHEVIASCRVGRRPADVAVHPETHEVYVPCKGTGDLAVLFPGATGVRTSFAAGRRPSAAALVPGRPGEPAFIIAAANFRVPGAVTFFDSSSLKVRAEVSVAGHPSHLAFDRGSRLLFVIHEGAPVLSIIDTDTLSLVAAPAVGISDQRLGPASQQVAIDRRGTSVYVANTLSSYLSVVNRK